jgi:hypothetical protein
MITSPIKKNDHSIIAMSQKKIFLIEKFYQNTLQLGIRTLFLIEKVLINVKYI